MLLSLSNTAPVVKRHLKFMKEFVEMNIPDQTAFRVHERAVSSTNHQLLPFVADAQIKCPCKPKTEGGIANCFENTNCPCYKANIMLRKLNYVRNNQTVYNSFGI
ncbi:hypothetical protein B9Z55_007856 [Caenorhabditis nigoni]|uniref:Uncharacterized protein n=1 Tax=Caenorhabditis nigoni TaxID=1611254 RepID=A0A2G5VBP4_9PELO|nr:hypothetical protein B9Z55_007856 [Caenorhabditis nigoni]